MRIGMMADIYKPHISGVTNYIALNKRFMEAAGHEVFVFTFGDEHSQDDETNVIRSPGLPISDTGFHFNLRYSYKVQKLFRTMEIIHVHHPFISGSLALRYSRMHGIPVVFTNHTRYDLYARAYLPVLGDALGETALKAYLPSFCRACDLVVSPSPGIRDILRRMGVEVPIEVIPNGVDLRPFLEPADPFTREQYGFQPEDVILVYTGRLGPEKNLPFLLRSFAGACHAVNHVRLLLVGDGPERDNLQDRAHYMGIEDRVYFTGLVPYDQVPRYLAMGDAFITASVTETFCLSIVEAMASGLPVLGILSPGIGDAIKDGVNGYLVPDEDLASFTALLTRLVIDRDKRMQMGDMARIESGRYDILRTTRLMTDLYQQTVDKSAHKNRSLGYRLRNLLERRER